MMPKCERQSSSLAYECYPFILSSRFEHQGVQPGAGRSKHLMRLCPRTIRIVPNDPKTINVQDIDISMNKISRKQVLATPAGKAWALKPCSERFLRARRLKPCPQKASAR